MGIVINHVPPQQTTIIQAHARISSRTAPPSTPTPAGTQILTPDSTAPQTPTPGQPAGTTSASTKTPAMIPGLPPFESIEKTLLPLSGQRIHEFRQMDRETQDAGDEPIVPVTGITQVITVDPNAGETPTIHLAAGYACSLTAVDGAGQPWPILVAAIGTASRFQVSAPEKGRISPTVVISDLEPHAQSNLLLTLDGLKTPIPVQLISGGPLKDGHKVVDYRVILRVRGMVPGSLPPTFSASPNKGTTAALLQALYGTMPSAAKPLTVEGAPAYSYTRAWLMNGELWIRTHARMLAPAWIATESGANGAAAYVLPKTHAILLRFDGINSTVEVK